MSYVDLCSRTHHGTTQVLEVQCAIRTIPRGRPMRIGSIYETISSMRMVNHLMRSTISSHTWMERPDDVRTRNSDTERCTARRGRHNRLPTCVIGQPGMELLGHRLGGLA
jgi:hypothetical protein